MSNEKLFFGDPAKSAIFDAGYVFDVGEAARKQAIRGLKLHVRKVEAKWDPKPALPPTHGFYNDLQNEIDQWLSGISIYG